MFSAVRSMPTLKVTESGSSGKTLTSMVDASSTETCAGFSEPLLSSSGISSHLGVIPAAGGRSRRAGKSGPGAGPTACPNPRARGCAPAAELVPGVTARAPTEPRTAPRVPRATASASRGSGSQVSAAGRNETAAM